MELAVKDILGEAIIPHMTDVAQPTQTSLPHDGNEVIRAGDMQGGGFRDVVPPRDTKDGAEANEVKCVVSFLDGGVCTTSHCCIAERSGRTRRRS